MRSMNKHPELLPVPRTPGLGGIVKPGGGSSWRKLCSTQGWAVRLPGMRPGYETHGEKDMDDTPLPRSACKTRHVLGWLRAAEGRIEEVPLEGAVTFHFKDLGGFGRCTEQLEC